ncbi:MAG: hypothetical protein GTN98_00450 [Woeseiaceae bacterium]|nr:hypothetical protein [Woeseiaceae bacterium]
MDHFEFILIITSVIYALAVAQILAGVSRIAQSTSTIKLFPPHTIWVLNLFVFIFLIWWASWEFRAVQWTFPQYAYMLVAPTLLFFACSLLVPTELAGAEVRMEEHFFRIRRPLFVSYFLAALAASVDGNLLADEALWHEGRYGHVTLLAAAAWGYFTAGRRAHYLIALASLLAIAFIVVTRFWLPR